jgi:hypothetical protein
MGGYFGGGGEGLGGGGEGLGGGGEGGGGEGEGGGGLGEVCCAAQLHPKRQMITNRNMNIWDATDRSLVSKEILCGQAGRFPEEDGDSGSLTVTKKFFKFVNIFLSGDRPKP